MTNEERARLFNEPVSEILGDFPWDRETLRKLFFVRFPEVLEALKAHPGYALHEDAIALQLSVDIFENAVQEMRNAVEYFRVTGGTDWAWRERHPYRTEPKVVAICRSLFAVAAAASALVDHCRRITRQIVVDGYRERIEANFAESPLHNFIKDLRNFLHHYAALEPNSVTTYRFGEGAAKSTQFLLERERLAAFEGWTPHSQTYIAAHPNGIDLEVAVAEYAAAVMEFQEWFVHAYQSACEPALGDYREYRRFLRAITQKQQWRIAFEQLLKDRDPYLYLANVLTPEEIEEVNRFPKRTRQQVDRIIELADHDGACDDELRAIAYRKFRVEPEES